MSDLLYKRLFEVNLLHDYYLVSADGSSFFEKSKATKEALLKSKLNHRMYNVTDFFEIEPSETTKKSLSEFKLIYRKTALGFVLGIQVKEELTLGATLYKPRFKFPETLTLLFQ